MYINKGKQEQRKQEVKTTTKKARSKNNKQV
jgi:hypothetical protein